MIAKESDYFNLTRCLKTNVTFNFIIGGRGTGKTYGTLSHAIKEKEIFCYMRRMEAEVSTIAREELNPFKALNRDKGWNIQASNRLITILLRNLQSFPHNFTSSR